MRVLLRLGVILAVLVLVAAAVAYLFFDVNRFREPVQAQMEKALGRKVSLGPMRLKLVPFAISIEQLAVSDDPAFGGTAPFLAAKELAINASLLPLILRREVNIQSVRITEPTLELIRSPQGKWNVSTLGATGGPAGQGGSASPLELAELQIENGMLAITDNEARKPRAEYRNIDLSLRDFAEGKPFHLNGRVNLPEKFALEFASRAQNDKQAGLLRIQEFSAKLGGLVANASGAVGTGANQSLDLKVTAKDASIVEAARVAAAFGSAFSPDMKVTGTVNADLAVKGTSTRPEVTGQMTASRLEMARAAWKLPVRIPEIRVDITPDSLKSNRFTAECGNTKIDAALSLSNYNNPDAFLAASITAGEARLEELLHIAGAYGLSTAAGMDGSGDVSLNARIMGRVKSDAPMAYSGSGYLRNATLHAPGLTKPIRVSNADLKFEQENAVLDNVNLSVAGSTLKGSLSVKRFSAPELHFKAQIDQVAASELQGLVKSAPAAAPAPKSSASGPLAKVTGGGSVSIGKLAYDNVTLTDVRAECTLDHGMIRLDPLTAELFGGKHTGSIAIDSRTEATRVSLKSKIEKVEANNLLSSATSVRQLLYGLLGADANLSFVSKPGEQIARTLNGTFQLRLTDGRLTGVNVVNELAQVAKALGYTSKVEPVTNIVKLTAGLDIKDGFASTNDLRMDFAGGSLSGSGVIGLADQSLKMKVLPVLSRQTSEQFGGGKVAGIMNTVLSNQNGELVIPVLVGGTIAQPRILPDGEMMAKMKVQGLLPTLTNPAALTSSVKGAIEEGRKGNVTGVIEAITGAGKKQPPETKGAEPAAAAKPEETKKVDPVDAGRKIGESIFDMLKGRKK